VWKSRSPTLTSAPVRALRSVDLPAFDRQSAGREDDRVGLEWIFVVALNLPSIVRRLNIRDEGVGHERHAFARRAREQPIAHVARALRRRKQLARLRFLDEREADLVLEKRDLLVQRPRSDHAPQKMRRRVGHEARLIQPCRQDIAASAAADQNLAAAVLRALDERRLGALGRREDRRHRAGRAGANYDNARHAASDWRKVRLKRPESSNCGGAVPGVMRDTP
jgi:hypothetical protein